MSRHLLFFLLFCALHSGREDLKGQEDPEPTSRSVIQIAPQDAKTSAVAVVPIDESNAFFLNHRGQVGVAKISPGLSLIGWQYYSEVKWDALPFLAQGPNYSIILSSPHEVTQSFDTDENVELDFFQRLVDEWPGKDRGSAITAGPVPDPEGRLLFAISPARPLPPEEGSEPVQEKAHIVAWHPESKELVTIMESSLPIVSFAVDRSGLLAALLDMPEYTGGYFISLTKLPSFDPESPDATPEPLPFTLPSLIIPSELTKSHPPTQLTFFSEGDTEKLVLVCPGSRQLVEVNPEEVEGVWGGSILLREIVEAPIDAVVEMQPGSLLAAGREGFVPLNQEDPKYRILRVGLAFDGIELELSAEVDRYEAVQPDHFLVQAVSLNGGERNLAVVPTVEADGRTVILKTETLPEETVIRIICHRLPSASGESLLSNAAFYTIHRKPVFED
ncbi:MAG: hypothetical protein AAF491_00540 [Verrucomicrobiota bacterium]